MSIKEINKDRRGYHGTLKIIRANMSVEYIIIVLILKQK